MFACFTCKFQTDSVSDFASHLQLNHADQQREFKAEEAEDEAAPSTSGQPCRNSIEVQGVATISGSPSVSGVKEECVSVDDGGGGGGGDDQVAEEGDDEDEIDDFYVQDFEPVIQIQVSSEEAQQECASRLFETKKHLMRKASDTLVLTDKDESKVFDEPFRLVRKRGRKKKALELQPEEEIDDDDLPEEPFLKKEPKKRGPKKKPEEEKRRKIYPCTHCIREFKNNCDLQRHITSTHLKLRPFKCDQCDSAFALLGNLKKHIGYVHLNMKRVPNKVTCQICGKVYNSNYHLTIHISSVHTMEKRFQCEYCGMKFAWKKCYERHISSVHLGEKNFRCEVCSSAFARKEHLKTHMKRHVREAK